MIRLKVKEVAKQKNFSQGKLARRADLDVQTLQKIYRTPTSDMIDMKLSTLDKLAKALDVDASELLESVADVTEEGKS